MSKAGELKERVLARIESRGITTQREFFSLDVGAKYAVVFETFKHNGAEENVTATIEADEKTAAGAGRRIFKIKVPKNASDKVIERRIDELEKVIKG